LCESLRRLRGRTGLELHTFHVTPLLHAAWLTAVPLEALAKHDSSRSTWSPLHFGHVTPSLAAPILWRS
jgi:hypothetical protein